MPGLMHPKPHKIKMYFLHINKVLEQEPYTSFMGEPYPRGVVQLCVRTISSVPPLTRICILPWAPSSTTSWPCVEHGLCGKKAGSLIATGQPWVEEASALLPHNVPLWLLLMFRAPCGGWGEGAIISHCSLFLSAFLHRERAGELKTTSHKLPYIQSYGWELAPAS